jgi:hypothetical protein
MTRHLILALGLALVAAATALLLADVGVFEGAERWLFARYRGESLWKEAPAAVWPWLPMVVAGVGALLVAWVAVDVATWTAKLAVLAATLGAVGFLSLTLAFYGMAYSPWPGLTAAALAFAMGCLLAETPSSRERRDTLTLLGRRAGDETLQAWQARGLTPPWREPGVREGAVLAVRVLSPAPEAEAVAAHLDQRGRALGEITRLLRQRPGVVLDLPSGDGVRAFFGFRPDATAGDLEPAAQAALELAMFLKEEATLQTQAGQAPVVWGLGLSFGALVTGRHGPESERFWTASGTAAEQARQLAALNARHQTSILVGRRAAEALAARFELRAVEGDAIHALIAAKPSPAPEELPMATADAEGLAEPDAPPKPASPEQAGA